MRPVQLSLIEAVDRFVVDGAQVFIGNFGSQLFAVGHALVRRRARDLDLVLSSGGILLDQLLGAGVVRSAIFAHCWSPVGPSPTYEFRRIAESGDDSCIFHELSLGHLAAALTGGGWGVPFMCVPDLTGTGYAEEDWSRGLLTRVDSGFGPATVVRSIRPDVAFVHVDTADADGNAIIRGPLGDAVLAARAARVVVLVAEEVRDDGSVVERGPDLPGLLVDAVVRHAGAVAPDGAAGRYPRDVAAYEEYAREARTPEGLSSWLDNLIPPEASDG